MSEAQAQARHQQIVEELCAASIRALSGEADLHFRARRLHRGRSALPLFAPHLHPSLETDDFASFRGAADGLALRLLQSDAALHEQLRPSEPVERLVFELLEQIRVEAMVPPNMPGVAHNLRHRYEAWSRAFHHSGLTDSARGLLIYTVAQICRMRVTNEPVLEETEDMMEATRAALSPLIGHALAGLRRDRLDQAAYAQHALAIARTISQMLRAEGGEALGERNGADELDTERAAFSLLMDLDAEITERFASAVSGRSRVLEESDDGYHVFTTAYDRKRAAATLVRPEVLRGYRDQLDARIAAQGVNVARLARELRALLAEPDDDGWDSAQEEGRIDGRRLSQLISSPTERRLFRSERVEP
jgi:cobaltochelatase CobT